VDLAARARGVYKTFTPEHTPVRALRGVDLDIAAGEFVAMVGPSGCGKSTLLNVIAGLDGEYEGHVEVAGERLDTADDDARAVFRRRHIGLVFQFFHALEDLTVLENVMLAGVIAGQSRRAAETRARELLDVVGIGEQSNRAPILLSGGERQRLTLARALANDPALLLADEPTGALDSEGSAEITELLRRLHADGQTILLVTHDASVAAAAERVVRMRDGQVVADT
jgi:putative ABC transport system ATP-binding protein